MYHPGLHRFAAPARPRAELWHTALGLIGITVIYLSAVYGTMGVVATQIGELRFTRLVLEMAAGSTPQGLITLLASFAPLGLAVIFVTRALHGRRAGGLFGPGAARDFGRVMLPLGVLLIVMAPLAVLDGNVFRATPLGTVLAWLPLALPLLMVQIGAEELLFRGYLLQQIAARNANPIAWMLLPSALFGALHYAPAEFGQNAIWPVLWAFAFGCFCADLTARAGNLGPALALHFTTNLSSMLIVGLYGNLDGLALYTLVINTRDPAALAPYLAIDVVAMLAAWAAARLMLRL